MSVRTVRTRSRGTVRLRRAAACVLVGGALLLTVACTEDDGGEGGEGADSSSAGNGSESPDSGEPTELDLGEPASLVVRAGPQKSSEVELTVREVEKGARKDLRDFALSGDMENAVPYYATVGIKNVGDGNLSRADVKLWTLDSTDTVRPPARIMGSFGKCEHSPLPRQFTTGKSARTCLTYLLPRRASLDAVQYRFDDDRAPYSWPVG